MKIRIIHGLEYAILDCLPERWHAFLKGWKVRIKRGQPIRVQITEDIRVYCRQTAKAAQGQAFAGAVSKIAGAYCSNLTLIAFK